MTQALSIGFIMSTSLLLALRSSNEIESDSLWVGFLICHLKQLADGTLKTVVSSINISELNLSVSNRSSQGFDFPVSYRNKHRTDPMLRFEYLLEAQDINQTLHEFGKIVEVRLLLASLNEGSLFNNGGEFEIVLHHGPKVEKMIVSHSNAMTHGLWWQIAKPNISSGIEILESPQLVVADQWHRDIKSYCSFVTQVFEMPAKLLAQKGEEKNTHPVVVATEPAYMDNTASLSEEGNTQKVLLTFSKAAQISKMQSYWPVYVVIGIVIIWLMITSDLKNAPIEPPVAEVAPVIDNVDHVMPEELAATDSALADPSEQLDYIADTDESHGSQYRTFDWLKAQGSSAWTLQIASFENESGAKSYLSSRGDGEPFAYFPYQEGEKTLYAVTYGSYINKDIALKSANMTDFGLTDGEQPIPRKFMSYWSDISANQLPTITQEVPSVNVQKTDEVKDVVLAKSNDDVKSALQSEKTATSESKIHNAAEAQNTMGWHYYHGDGVKQDYEESFKWFQKAAKLGEPSAQFNVGMMYAAGTGTKQDFIEAEKWYRKSAEQGKTSAQLNLGMMYISGRGIRQNLPEGIKWLNKAAKQGNATAKANLKWLSQQGYISSSTVTKNTDVNSDEEVILSKKSDDAKVAPQDEKNATGNSRAIVDVNAINIKIVTLAKQKDNSTLVEWEASNKSGVTLSLVKFKIDLFDDGEVPQVKTTIKDSFKVLGPCGTLPYRMIFSHLGDLNMGRVAISVVEAEAYAPNIAPLSCN